MLVPIDLYLKFSAIMKEKGRLKKGKFTGRPRKTIKYPERKCTNKKENLLVDHEGHLNARMEYIQEKKKNYS